MDDLDSLLQDLSGGPPSSAPQAAPKTELDELDDLLNNIGNAPPTSAPATNTTGEMIASSIFFFYIFFFS